jgi:hypothetical protein
MRNLKRALSLALATVMTMGMMVVGSSASYADVDSSYNQEAINVAQAVGIMTGDENGNFNPDNGVTRNEMAVIMCNLLDLKVGDTTSPFTDVDSWAAPYVAACYNNGIVAGTSATTYGGNDTVTSAQAALMVMKALGYFGYQGEFGQDWKVAVTKKANQISLFDDIKTYVDQALTRNEVAQLVLNALESNVMVVTEEGGVNVSTGDVAVSVQATYTEKKIENKSYDYSGRALDATGDTYQQLCEKLYGRDLVKNGSTTDDLGRPATKWTYLGDAITSTKTSDTTYTDAVALKDVYADLNLSGAETISIYLNNTDTYVNVTIAEKKGDCFVNYASTVASGTAINIKTDTLKIGGKGYILEFFVDNTKAIGSRVSAVAYTEFLAKATADYNTEDESVGISIYSDAISGLSKLESEDFAGLESIKEDDYLLITAGYNKNTHEWVATSVGYPQIITGVTATGYKSYETITAGGTTYNYDIYAARNTGSLGNETLGSDYMSGDVSLDKEYDLYLNSNGYVIGVDKASTSADLSDYLFVKEVSTNAFDTVAKVVFMDGTSATITVAKLDSSDVNVQSRLNNGGACKAFYTYKVKSNGEYELTSEAKQTYSVAGTDIKTGNVKPVGGSFIANSDTVYVNKDKVSVGVKNAPTISSGDTVYALYNDSNVIKAVYTANRGKVTSSSDSEYVYLLGYDGKNIDGDDTYYTYKAIVNGVKTTVNLSDDVDITAVNGSTETAYTLTFANADKGLYRVDGYEDSYIADLTRYESSETIDNLVDVVATVGKDSISYKSGTVRVATAAFSLTDDAELYVIDNTDSDKLTVLSSGSQLNSLSNGTYRVYVIMESDKDTASASVVYAVRTSTEAP